MRAVLAKDPGPPEVLSVVDPADPEPAPGQVVVAVDVVAVSDIDTQPRAGRARSAAPRRQARTGWAIPAPRGRQWRP